MVCVLGLGRGFRAGTGTQAWACTLCSHDVGPFPARLPWPARHAAGGWCPPITCPPNARGCHLPRLAQGTPGALLSPVPSLCSPLSSQPLSYPLALSLAPSSPTRLPLQTLTHRVPRVPRASHWLQPPIPQPLERGLQRSAQPGGRPTLGHLLQSPSSSRSRQAIGQHRAGLR